MTQTQRMDTKMSQMKKHRKLKKYYYALEINLLGVYFLQKSILGILTLSVNSTKILKMSIRQEIEVS